MDIKAHAKKVLAVLISLVLTISLLPVYSFADEEMENKDLTNTENTSSGNTEENSSEETDEEDATSDTEEDTEITSANTSTSNKSIEDQSEESKAASSKDESNKETSEDGTDSLISEYAEKNDLANSWRYTNGELTATEVKPKTRAVSNAWEWTDEGYISSNGSVIEGAKYKGIDVSEHNGKIDWKKVKADGIDFAIIRCGYGMDEPGQDDDYWEYNVSECERLGIPYGVYLYSYADSTTRASKEADHTLRLLEGHNPQLPVYYDLEETSLESTSNRTLLANMAKTYCNKIEDAGYVAGVYSNTNWWNNYLTSSVFDQWDRWVAQYNYECRYKGEYTLWQCTSTGKVDGVKGNVDINFMFNSKYMGPLEKDSNGIRYRNSDGSYAANEWKTVEGSTYYFGKDGYALRWSQTIDGNRYYFNGSYQMVTGWVKWSSDGTRSYFGEDGVALSGWQDIDGKTYYFDPENDFHAARYRSEIEGQHYYFNGSCQMFVGLLNWSDGTKSYFDSNGHPVTEWKTVNGKTYYFDPDSNDDYPVALRWSQTIDGNRYYFREDCSMYTGILLWNSDGTRSFFGSDGVMQSSGWCSWNGKKYYINPKTERAVKYSQTISGNRYYFKEDCSMHTGWLKWNSDGKYSYFKPNGMMVFGTYTIDGVKFNFGTSGKVNSMDPVRTDMINKAQKYSSGTKYLILVDLSGHKVGVFKGKKNNWSLQYYWSCAVGKSSTPTIKGTYRTTGFTRPYLTTDSRAIYCTQIWGGYFFHSILSSENELGKNVSHGCIRLPYSAANWIYKNINSGTTVYIYK